MQGLALEPIELMYASTRQPSQHSVRPPRQTNSKPTYPGRLPGLFPRDFYL
jgi:hypothetical protein